MTSKYSIQILFGKHASTNLAFSDLLLIFSEEKRWLGLQFFTALIWAIYSPKTSVVRLVEGGKTHIMKHLTWGGTVKSDIGQGGNGGFLKSDS